MSWSVAFKGRHTILCKGLPRDTGVFTNYKVFVVLTSPFSHMQGGIGVVLRTPPNGLPQSCVLRSFRARRFNANLYADGKVCLSILGTASGASAASGEAWNPETSSLWQVISHTLRRLTRIPFILSTAVSQLHAFVRNVRPLQQMLPGASLTDPPSRLAGRKLTIHVMSNGLSTAVRVYELLGCRKRWKVFS